MAKQRTRNQEYGTRNQADYGLAQEIHKFHNFRKKFYQLLGDTQKALKEVAHLNLIPLESTILESLSAKQIIAKRPTVIVVLGPARGRLVNFLLGEKLLPPQSNISSKLSGWRWLRLQYGIRKQVRVNFGPDFEIVEPNLLATSDWDRIPTQNLKRNSRLDLSTIMEIELCNPFLENGVQILIPPDIGSLAFDKGSYSSFLNNYESFFSKREKFLENIFPLILYAIDEIEPLNIKTEAKPNIDTSNISDNTKNLDNAYSENPFVRQPKSNNDNYTTFSIDSDNNSFYSLNSTDSVGIMFEANKNNSTLNRESDKNESWGESSQPSLADNPGLSDDNILDLQQVYQLHPNAEVLIVFLSNVNEDLNSSPTINTMNYDKFEQAMDDETNLSTSVSSDLFYMSPERSDKKSLLNMNNDLNSNHPKYTDNTASSSVNDNPNSKNISEEERQELLQKQKHFLTMLVEQLKLMSNPILEKSFTAHWLIVDESRRNFKYPTNEMNHQNRSKSEFNVVIQKSEFSKKLSLFARNCLQKYMLRDCIDLSQMHTTLLEQFILTSFDMAREMQIIPRKINYAAKMEQELYDAFNTKLDDGENREKLLEIINNVLRNMKNVINNTNTLDIDPQWQSSFRSGYSTSTSTFYTDVVVESPMSTEDSLIKDASLNNSSQIFEPLIESNLSNDAACDVNDFCIIEMPPKIPASVTEGIEVAEDPGPSSSRYNVDDRNNPVFADNDVALDYTIFDILCNSQDSQFVKERRTSQTSFKQASLDVQRTVLATLSGNISVKLVNFMNFLRDDYYGTLQRCLISLEEGHREPIASEAVKQILLVTKHVDLQNCASFSFLHTFVDHLRRFFNRLSLSSHSNESSSIHSPRWRQQIALNTIESLNASKLAKLITTQLRDKIRLSHEKFQSALNSLSEYHSGRLRQTEELKLMVRKLYAPRFARLCLESTSLADSARFGIPRLGKELGRGQYGVVYSVKGRWGSYEPCAVKSVVPPDKRHFNELAMEFYHTRSLPSHDRIVNLYGSVIDYSYGCGNPAVLLVSERLKWDLLCALQQAKLNFTQRMQIAVDIVEGIRYLHSRGLVHRDIKLKNVLLDESHRAKLTDLGFCIPEAMMSGSIVGTPIHMAPELLVGTYDNSVDVYAFGILFWYVCAGDVHSPTAFEIFRNKEQLWTSVKKGLRPERLDHFSDVCWSLMEKCWAADPAQRPFLGDVEPLLKEIRDNPILHNRRI